MLAAAAVPDLESQTELAEQAAVVTLGLPELPELRTQAAAVVVETLALVVMVVVASSLFVI